jgi:hypothetical protein
MNKDAQKQMPRDVVCTCKTCNHGIARDCIKLACNCCKDDDHVMVIDGMVGYGQTHKK